MAKKPTKEVKFGIIRYLQLHPVDDPVISNALKLEFKRDVYTEEEWERVIQQYFES